MPPTLSIVAMSDRQERRRQLTRRTREVPSLEYCMLLTDRWLASLADHFVKLKCSVLPDCQTVSHHALNYCILCCLDFSCFVCSWCTQVFIPRIFQKELNIRLAGYPPALAGGYSASSTKISDCWFYCHGVYSRAIGGSARSLSLLTAKSSAHHPHWCRLIPQQQTCAESLLVAFYRLRRLLLQWHIQEKRRKQQETTYTRTT